MENLFNFGLDGAQMISVDVNPEEEPVVNQHAGEPAAGKKEGEGDKPLPLIQVDLNVDETGEIIPPETNTGTEDQPGAETTGKSSKQASPLSPYAASLKEEGILPNLDVEKVSGLPAAEQAQALLDEMTTTIEKKYDEYVQSVDPRLTQILNNYKKGVPLIELLEWEQDQFAINSIKKETLATDEDLAENVVRAYYRATAPNMKADKVEKVIADAKTNGTLTTEAEEGYEELKKIISAQEQEMVAEAEATRQKNEQAREKTMKDINDKIDALTEIIPGVEISKKQKELLKSYITKPVRVDTLPDGRKVPVSKVMDIRNADPIEFDARLAYFIEMGFFGKDAKFDKLVTKAKSTAAARLAADIESASQQSRVGKPVTDRTDSGANDNPLKGLFSH